MQTAIRCTMMRGGTSRGAYFLANDLPDDRTVLAEVLAAAMGSPNNLQLDGIGGGTSITSKVAIVSPSEDRNADIDYLFAQVSLEKATADFSPSCGNILAGVAPFAIEMGLVRAQPEETPVIIRNLNTNSYIEAIVQTPDRSVTYEGDSAIDGIVGTSAPIILNFLDAVGSKTGKLLPTGNPVDEVCGVQVSCVDAAVPMVLIPAIALGKSGNETQADFNADRELLARIEEIRRSAGKLMGMGDVAESVTPKVGILSIPRHGGTITSRYFVPDSCHGSHAVTGAICVASAVLIQGSVANAVASGVTDSPAVITIEHPSGTIDIKQEYSIDNSQLKLIRSGVLRTARMLFRGELYVSRSIWSR